MTTDDYAKADEIVSSVESQLLDSIALALATAKERIPGCEHAVQGRISDMLRKHSGRQWEDAFGG